jgi:hypothetical protein
LRRIEGEVKRGCRVLEMAEAPPNWMKTAGSGEGGAESPAQA